MTDQTITKADAEQILYGSNLASQEVEQHRWYVKRLIVFELDSALMGFYYLDPATEEQEDQDRFEGDQQNVAIFPVTAVETTVYEVTQ